MPRITYEPWSPSGESKALVSKADEIARSYAGRGYDLTLRQLYYQFVSRDLLPNNQRSYDKLGAVVARARMAGLLDWNHITDRTRNMRKNSHWGGPAEIIHSAARSFAVDKWADQPQRVEVWVEKEALAGIVERVASRHDVAWLSCRGYMSASEMWTAGRRIGNHIAAGQAVTILHLGDHDPSGIDMTRDIQDRLTTFITQDWLNDRMPTVTDVVTTRDIIQSMREGCLGDPFTVKRIALTMEQIEEHDPPPNPAKITDSRAASYMDLYGDESWELDALSPEILDDLIEQHIVEHTDLMLLDAKLEEEKAMRRNLTKASTHWHVVDRFLDSFTA